MTGFAQRHRVTLLAIALMGVALGLVSASARQPAYQDPIARVLLDVLGPVQWAVTAAHDQTAAWWSRYVALIRTEEENETLREQVASLEAALGRVEELERSHERLAALLDLRSRIVGPALAARVIARDPLPWSQTLTIDRGERDGIRPAMAVVSPHGVVGQVAEVGWGVSQVLLLTDPNSGIDANVRRSRARGIVQGGVDDSCYLKYVRPGEDVAVGDQVMTSGMDGIFPKGLVVGEVVDVERRAHDLLQIAVVRPSAPLDRLEEVLVVDAAVTVTEAAS